MIRGEGYAVVGPGEAPATRNGAATTRTTIDGSTGCRNLVQRVIEYTGGTDVAATPGSEEVGYVVEGTGRLIALDRMLGLEPGTGFLVPPDTPYAIEPEGTPLTVVSVLSPPPGGPGSDGAPPAACAVVREQDQEPLPAGDTRTFKLLVDPAVGCRGITQFVGFIQQSRAPEHVHTYEEVIHILDGTGTLHAGDARVPFEAGASIYLSPGTPHCLENGNTGTLRLLGVFSPAGSPADKRE